MIFKIFLLWIALALSFYVIVDQIQAVEVVTQAGKILGVAIWAALAAGMQSLFWTGRMQKYRFSATLLVLSLVSAVIVKFLPGYSVKDLNLLLTANILATLVSIVLATLLRKHTAPSIAKPPLRKKK